MNSIRSRMVSGFLFLTFLILVMSLVSLYLLDRTSRIAGVHGDISRLQVYTLSLFKNDNDFFDLEPVNDAYFKTHQSPFLNIRDSLNQQISKGIQVVLSKTENKHDVLRKNLQEIGHTLSLYNQRFDTLEGLLYRRGFRDHGLEGAMRFHAHALEQKLPVEEIAALLYLRRHEKDFFLRNDSIYIHAYTERARDLTTTLRGDHRKNKASLFHLAEYQRLFFELADVQTRIGLTSMSGLRHEFKGLAGAVGNQYLSLTRYSADLSSKAEYNARIICSVLLTVAILFSVFTGSWISKRLSEPIARLSNQLRAVTSYSKIPSLDLDTKTAAAEINTITSAFYLLAEEARAQLKENRHKSKLLKKKNKALKKLNRELDNFLYSTAHDLRSPLTSLLGLLNIIKYENTQENLTHYFLLMQNSIYRMETFIEQIVSYSKNKNLIITNEKINLRDLVHDVFENHRFVEGADRIQKIIAVEENFPCWSDAKRLLILFNNLISNAIKYADPDKQNSFVKINIQVYKDHFTIEFQDNGIGIGSEHLDKIFKMFYRADLRSKGSGLGLFIFNETIKRMQGSVFVNAAVGEGTRFFIRLPNQLAGVEESSGPVAYAI